MRGKRESGGDLAKSFHEESLLVLKSGKVKNEVEGFLLNWKDKSHFQSNGHPRAITLKSNPNCSVN